MGAILNTWRKDLRGRLGGVIGKHGLWVRQAKTSASNAGLQERSLCQFPHQGNGSTPQNVVRIK